MNSLKKKNLKREGFESAHLALGKIHYIVFSVIILLGPSEIFFEELAVTVGSAFNYL